MQTPFSRYVKTLGSITLVTLCSTALFNWLVDPYALFDAPRITNFNLHKTDLYKYARMSLAHNSWKKAPQQILLGSSRSYFGFDSTKPLPNGSRYFNLALPGSNFYEAYRYFLHANQRQLQKTVLIGADMFMFNQHLPVNETFSNDRLAANASGEENPGYWQVRLRDQFNALLTTDALEASLRTVHKQKLIEKYQVKGFEGEGVGMIRDVVTRGARSAFLRMQGMSVAMWCPPPAHAFSPGDTHQPDTPMGALRLLLRHAYANNIDVRLFIPPSHAYLWEAMDMAGLWDTFESWKKLLVAINEEEAGAAGMPPFPLWDFSGYNEYTTEEVPPANDRRLMQWYWEGTHFRPALGERVLQRIFSDEAATPARLFGMPLNSLNIQSWLADIRLKREQYRATHAADIVMMKNPHITPAVCLGRSGGSKSN